METLDISSNKEFPAGALSNFTAHRFTFRGIECASPEGALQGMKVQDAQEQLRICGLVGKAAKRAGQVHNETWQATQTLWWQGVSIARTDADFQLLLDELFEAISQNAQFREALLASGTKHLTHSIGCADPTKTVLTEEEFCSRLMRIRAQLRK